MPDANTPAMPALPPGTTLEQAVTVAEAMARAAVASMVRSGPEAARAAGIEFEAIEDVESVIGPLNRQTAGSGDQLARTMRVALSAWVGKQEAFTREMEAAGL